jgi:hypothetical protein
LIFGKGGNIIPSTIVSKAGRENRLPSGCPPGRYFSCPLAAAGNIRPQIRPDSFWLRPSEDAWLTAAVGGQAGRNDLLDWIMMMPLVFVFFRICGPLACRTAPVPAPFFFETAFSRKIK